jgi:hypothetical protein
MPQLLYPQGKSPWYALVRRLGGPQSQSGCVGEEKNSQPLLGLQPPIIQPVAQCYTTEVSGFYTILVANEVTTSIIDDISGTRFNTSSTVIHFLHDVFKEKNLLN